MLDYEQTMLIMCHVTYGKSVFHIINFVVLQDMKQMFHERNISTFSAKVQTTTTTSTKMRYQIMPSHIAFLSTCILARI